MAEDNQSTSESGGSASAPATNPAGGGGDYENSCTPAGASGQPTDTGGAGGGSSDLNYTPAKAPAGETGASGAGNEEFALPYTPSGSSGQNGGTGTGGAGGEEWAPPPPPSSSDPPEDSSHFGYPPGAEPSGEESPYAPPPRPSSSDPPRDVHSYPYKDPATGETGTSTSKYYPDGRVSHEVVMDDKTTRTQTNTPNPDGGHTQSCKRTDADGNVTDSASVTYDENGNAVSREGNTGPEDDPYPECKSEEPAQKQEEPEPSDETGDNEPSSDEDDGLGDDDELEAEDDDDLREDEDTGEEEEPTDQDDESEAKETKCPGGKCPPGDDVSIWDDIVKPFAQGVAKVLIPAAIIAGVVIASGVAIPGIVLGGLAVLGAGLVGYQIGDLAANWGNRTVAERSEQMGEIAAGLGLLAAMFRTPKAPKPRTPPENLPPKLPPEDIPPPKPPPEEPPPRPKPKPDEDPGSGNKPKPDEPLPEKPPKYPPGEETPKPPNYNELVNEGYPELPTRDLNSFGQAKPLEIPPGEKLTLYRVYGKPAGPDGPYYSTEPPPATEAAWRDGSAIKPGWNSGTRVEVVEVQGPAKVWQGPTRAQETPSSVLPGGDNQVFAGRPPFGDSNMRVISDGPTPWNK